MTLPGPVLAQLRADTRAAQWAPAFEREWAAALGVPQVVRPMPGPSCAGPGERPQRPRPRTA